MLTHYVTPPLFGIFKIPNSQSSGDMGDIYSQVRSGAKSQDVRSKARVDSEVQIMQSAISNLKVR